jgi:hypothetical protein
MRSDRQIDVLVVGGANFDFSIKARRLFAASSVLLAQLESGVATTLAAARLAREPRRL